VNTKCNVLDLVRFLVAVENNPELFAGIVDLGTRLKSQGAMAKMDIEIEVGGERFHYYGGALNTLRARAKLHLVGGFTDLDQLRVRACESLSRYKNQATRRTNTKAYFKQKYKEACEELEVAHQSNMILLQAVSRLIFDIKFLRDEADFEKRAVFAADMVNDIRSIISIRYPLRVQPGRFSDDANVVEFKR
jgi:hypothetical protein